MSRREENMDTWLDFTVLGLTAPIASGCTSLAEFLTSTTFKEDFGKLISEEIETNNTNINILYKEIKTERTRYQIQFEQDKYVNELAARQYEEMSQELNRKLKRCLEKRQYLTVLKSQSDFHFTKISLSNLIIKKCIEVRGEKGFEQLPDIFKSNIMKCNVDRTLGVYNHIIERQEFDELTTNDKLCTQVISMYNEFGKIKNNLREQMDYDQYVKTMQDIGNNLRRCGHPYDYDSLEKGHQDILAIEANQLIKFYRHMKNKNNLFIIESFRNPSEVYFFRNRYSRFYLISIEADYEKRKNSRYFSQDREAFDRGASGNKETYVQQVSQCVRLSDIAIYNKEFNTDYLIKEFLRYLALIMQPGCIPPKMTELLMHEAYSVSLRSNCISRQVGAIITNVEGYVLSAGWNDVGSGQLGCGLLIKSDFESDEATCGIWKELIDELRNNGVLDDIDDSDSFCFKDRISQNKIIQKVLKLEDQFIAEIPEQSEENLDLIEQVKKQAFKEIKTKLNVKRLEYARALHAEENALIQLARNGSQGVYGGTIYTTTFPCELCSKKIYQAGLRKIVYTEPYPDAESIRFLNDGTRYLQLIPFEGVKSFSFFKLFKANADKKERQKLKTRS